MIKNQWYAILSSSDININQIVSVKRCGLNLVLFRDSDSKLSCLSEYCPHRGASLSLFF
ncbi:Rieske (2Fe-2S) protein [Peptoniphilus olsenii]|uniref:Rieske (2Fe-2S) protein n=1 Tax=Peptoniphilus olsenii TaxID=411570 RepID=UPI003396F5EF